MEEQVRDTEEALRESREQLRLAQEIGRIGTFEWNIQTNQIVWTGELEALYGLAPGRFGGKYEDWTSLIHPEDRPEAEKRLREAFKSGQFEAEWRVLDREGRTRWLAARGHVFKDENGAPQRMIGVNIDITDRKKAEEERLKIETKLQQAQKLESIGVLAGGIAHDFNNLLAGLFGHLELARMFANEGYYNRIASTLSKAGEMFERAKSLTQQLITFSKGGAPSPKTRRLPEFLRDTAMFVLSGTNINIEFKLPDNLWPCKLDENQMSQALGNILLNAKEAMPQGGTVMIRADNLPADTAPPYPLGPGSYVRIAIEDRGPGISKENLGKIFDPFFSTKEGASGLGLSIAYSITKKHGGIIEADSKLGKGSIFYIYLPAIAEVHTKPEKTGRIARTGAARVLVMDDQEFILDVAEEMIRALGYEVTGATSSEETLRIFKEAKQNNFPYDVVVLDLTMPGGIGGKQVFEELKRIDPDVRAIVSSGYSNDPLVSDPTHYGFRGAVPKPFTVRELETVLKRALE